MDPFQTNFHDFQTIEDPANHASGFMCSEKCIVVLFIVRSALGEHLAGLARTLRLFGSFFEFL